MQITYINTKLITNILLYCIACIVHYPYMLQIVTPIATTAKIVTIVPTTMANQANTRAFLAALSPDPYRLTV